MGVGSKIRFRCLQEAPLKSLGPQASPVISISRQPQAADLEILGRSPGNANTQRHPMLRARGEMEWEGVPAVAKA